MFDRKPREPSLRRRISRQCRCSRRSVYLLDEQYDFPTDTEIDDFIDSVRPTPSFWSSQVHDCDDIARELWNESKCWFRARGKNVASAFIWRQATAFSKAHALNFFVRKSDHKLIFIDNLEKVPFVGRAYLVVM